MKLFSYEHVQRHSDIASIPCYCEVYHRMQSENTVGQNITPDCMHCKFIRIYGLENYHAITSVSMCGRQDIKVYPSDIRYDVVSSTDTAYRNTVKFSVKETTDETLAFAQIPDKGTFIAYQSGKCNIGMNNFLLVMKYYIWRARHYKSKFNLKSLRIEIFKRTLVHKRKLSIKGFEKKWLKYIKLLENLDNEFAPLEGRFNLS